MYDTKMQAEQLRQRQEIKGRSEPAGMLREVPGSLEHLANSLDKTHALVQQLAARLEPVLQPSGPQDGETMGSPNVALCPVATQVHNHADIADGLNIRLSELLERLGV